ncbi:MAG: sulfatase [Phycisphaeraceae bacterium]
MTDRALPNIIYMHAHDAGRYVQPYGHPVETPNLMKFAKQGVLFRKAFCMAPTCGPSRAGMLCGQYPHEVNMYGLPHEGWALGEHLEKHWVRKLNGWGYETALAGVQHEVVSKDHESIGYQKYLSERDYPGEFYQETIDHVERYLAHPPKDKPFFISIGIDEPHRDNLERPEVGLYGGGDRFSKTRYYDPDKLDSRYTAPPPWLPDLPEIRKDMEAYRVGVRLMDEYMGRVLYALEQHALEEDTLVIITADHGIEFPGGKMGLSDQGTEVMLMIRGCGFEGGQVIEPVVSHVDLYPTLLDVLGKQVDHELRGKSLLPLAKGETDKVRDYVFAEQTYHGKGGFEPLRSVRGERYKLVRRHFPEGPRLRQDGPSNKVMEQVGFYDRHLAREELFDLYIDPWEACNRIDDPALQGVRKELGEALDQWMEETGDPFPTGNFPKQPAF